jgi:3-carboxy-cis,cis-muconate cycloisomerase
VLTAAARAPGLVATVFGGMVQEHERALGGWQAEWDALPDLARLAGGALAHIEQLATGLEVNTGRLAANLDATHGLVLGEAVMLALGEHLGRLEAHHRIEHASKQAVATQRTLYEVLAADPVVTHHLPADRLRGLFDPAHYVGEAHAFVDAVLALHAAREQRSPAPSCAHNP